MAINSTTLHNFTSSWALALYHKNGPC